MTPQGASFDIHMAKFLKCCALMAAVAAALSSCSWRVERDPDVLALRLTADPPTLNPVTATDVTAGQVGRYVFESLLERDNETLELVPSLAERWEVSNDKLSYTFWLRKGVRWHDGAPFGADDVIFTFERIRDPKVDAARLRNYFRDVKSIEKVGEDAVRFVYARPYFKALEMCGTAAIIPKHLFADGDDFNSHPLGRAPVGTGPYRFAEWKSGQRIVLARNEGYWGEKPAISGIVFNIIPDQMVAFELLKKGALDLSTMRAIQWVRQTESSSFASRFDKYRYYLPNYFYVGWNMRSPLFSDRRVRIAMTMLVNRRAILEKVLLGQGEVVASNFYRFGRIYDESIEPYPFDPQRARELLEEAGWSDTDGDGVRDKDGVEFRFTMLSSSSDSTSKSLGLFMREELRKVGIVMEVQQFEWATMLDLLSRRDFDAASLGWSTTIEEDPYQVWHSSQAIEGSNFVGFSDARADRLIEEARQEFDPAVREKLYREFQGILHREEPYTFLFTVPSLVAVAKRFEGVKAYRLGVDTLEWKVGPWPALMQW